MKNVVMERIQRFGNETPENGVDYIEQTRQIGGGYHNPRFEAEVGETGKPSVFAQGSTKKEALKKAWHNYCTEEGYL